MKVPELASKFCQICWVVKDITAAEKFFVETIGIKRFLRMENLAAKGTEGTYRGKPGDWVCNLYIACAGVRRHQQNGSTPSERAPRAPAEV